jgi:hypothetical protein
VKIYKGGWGGQQFPLCVVLCIGAVDNTVWNTGHTGWASPA